MKTFGWIVLIILLYWLLSKYQNRLDPNMTFSEWLSELWDLIKMSDKSKIDLLNVAIYSHKQGII